MKIWPCRVVRSNAKCLLKRATSFLLYTSMVTALGYTILKHSAKNVAPLGVDKLKHWTEMAEEFNYSHLAATRMSRNWVVSIAANAYTYSLCQTLSAVFHNWTILISSGTKFDTHDSRCIVYDIDAMKKISQQMELSWEHLLYLIAMQNGAEVIYVVTASDTLDNLSNEAPLNTDRVRHTGLVFASPTKIFNASQQFGCNMHNVHTTSYKLCEQPIAGIQTTVDCIESSASDDVKINCDKHSPGVTLERGTFIVSHLRRNLFFKDSFWALPFFYSKENRALTMWQMVAQRLLWISGNRIFVRGCDSRQRAYVDSRIYKQIAKWLSQWSCTANTFLKCAFLLMQQFSTIFLLDDTNVYKKWMAVLATINYEFRNHQYVEVPKCHAEPVLLTNEIRDKMSNAVDIKTAVNLLEADKLYEDTCFNSDIVDTDFKIDITTLTPNQFADILLVIVFNEPLFRVIPYVDALYRPYFSHILYCGPGHLDVTKHPQLSSYAISFVSYGTTPDNLLPGSLNYKCLTLVVDLGLRAIRGYLFAADDLLLGLPIMAPWDRDVIWTVSERDTIIADVLTHKECQDGANVCRGAKHQYFWSTYEKPLLAVLNTMQTGNLAHYFHNLARANGGYKRVNYAFADVFYVPHTHAYNMAEMARVFYKNHIHVEIAVPTMIRAVDGRKQYMSGYNMPYGNERDMPWMAFTKHMLAKRLSYLHPTKWSHISRKHFNFTKFFCSSALPYLHSPYNMAK